MILRGFWVAHILGKFVATLVKMDFYALVL